MTLLDGKNALVTGGGRGIGKAVALDLARNGANVAVCDINEETAGQTAEEAKSLGVSALTIKVDVTKGDDVAGMVSKAASEFKNIDILVNNAGITRDNLLIRMKEDDWNSVLSVNLKSAFLCTKEVARHMMKAKQGRIVNIASVIGLIGNAGQVNER